MAVVSGVRSGIGRAIVLKLSDQGASVVAWDLDGDAGRELVDEIRSRQGYAAHLLVDVADSKAVVTAAAETCRRFGKIDLLVNNSGAGTSAATLLSTRDSDWRGVLQANLDAAFFCLRAVAPRMLERRYGRIVNICSSGATPGLGGQAAHWTAKAGLQGLTVVAARELGPFGITVNAVAPGLIRTDARELLLRGEYAAGRGNFVSRIGEPAEVAGLVGFLSSPSCSYITGEVIRVDGGWGQVGDTDDLVPELRGEGKRPPTEGG